MAVVLFLRNDLSKNNISNIEKEIKKSSLAKSIQFVSSEQALKTFREKFPELQPIVTNLDTNPFPPSFEVAITDNAVSSDEIQSFIEKMEPVKGIDDIQFNRDLVDRMQSFSRLAKAVGFFLGGILILASFFIISNVIKLNVFARRNEIEILRLIGATNTFTRIPFLLEGIILGMIGGGVSLFLLFLLINLFPFYLGTSLGALSELINFRYLSMSQSLSLTISGAFIGFLGSLSSLARFLKE
ncbi:cell division protein FtsX [Acidobacteriota bacterium]